MIAGIAVLTGAEEAPWVPMDLLEPKVLLEAMVLLEAWAPLVAGILLQPGDPLADGDPWVVVVHGATAPLQATFPFVHRQEYLSLAHAAPGVQQAPWVPKAWHPDLSVGGHGMAWPALVFLYLKFLAWD